MDWDPLDMIVEIITNTVYGYNMLYFSSNTAISHHASLLVPV